MRRTSRFSRSGIVGVAVFISFSSVLVFLAVHDSYEQFVYSRINARNIVVYGKVQAPGQISEITFALGPVPVATVVAYTYVTNQSSSSGAGTNFSGQYGQYSTSLKNGQSYSVGIDFVGGLNGGSDQSCGAGTLNLHALSGEYSYDVSCESASLPAGGG